MQLNKLLFLKTSLVCLSIACTATIHANTRQQLTNNMPTGGVFKRLSTYQELVKKLDRIDQQSIAQIHVGSLIENNDNQGLLNIDVPLNPQFNINHEVCSNNSSPTIREAIICTINDGGRGNTEPSNIGRSTQGRELLAVRMGNPEGTKVMIITQQHGNEVASTEAALKVTKWLSISRGRAVKNILEQLDILLLIRANPDGGEPDPERCTIDPATGSVIDNDCALIRQNIDASAGGGFLSNSEADFVGVVGRGYDLNRYHHVGLSNPIRPVETQAMVAAALVFQPKVVLDLHGDLHKTDCQLDYASIVPGAILGLLPTGECITPDVAQDFRLLSPFADAIPGSAEEFVIQSLAADIMLNVQQRFQGSVGRFSQIQTGAGSINSGATASYSLIGAGAGGWETVNFSEDIRADVIAIVQGQPVIGFVPGLPDPSLLKKQIRINIFTLFNALKTLAQFNNQPPSDGSNFCSFPLANGLIANLPEKYWGEAATDGSKMVPIAPEIGVPIYISGNCPDNPVN